MVEKVNQGIALFNRGEFLAASELFEEVWRGASEPERPLYDAIMRIGAALHLRLNRGGGRGSVNLLQQALVRLEDLRPTCSEIDTGTLYEETAAYLEQLRGRRHEAGWFERFRVPRIRLVPPPGSTP